MQPAVQHQMMGYDRTSTMFSPDGRLLQVEYAKKAVKQGTPSVGIACKDGVLLVADKKVLDKLIVTDSVEKVFQVDEHIGASATGYLMDGRVLVERSQLIAQQHRVTYDEPIEVKYLVKEVCNLKQAFTQYGGARPFGISLLFASIDEEEKPRLFETEPTGMYFEFKATAIGEGEEEIKKLLDKEYKESMSLDEGLKLGLKALKKVLGSEFDVNRIDGAFVNVKDKIFTKYSLDDMKKALK
jgi:proteasome alpha subunit